jgi:hypothetical protein
MKAEPEMFSDQLSSSPVLTEDTPPVDNMRSSPVKIEANAGAHAQQYSTDVESLLRTLNVCREEKAR